jgi:TIR domain-containing protein
MDNKPKLKLFISHAYDEASVAISLQRQIQTDFLGLVHVFVSSNRSTLLPGEDWPNRVREELNAAELFAVLCSDRSLVHPWVNIEIGAAFFRNERPLIIPLCHRNLDEGKLELPLSPQQAITISSGSHIKAFYELLAEQLGSGVPAVDFNAIAANLKKAETEYIENSRQTEQSARLPGDGSTTIMIQDPAVLCISSKQFEETAKKDFELIRQYLPAKLNHKVVVKADEVRQQLGSASYDIVHLALYICPLSGDLVFADIDPQTKKATSKATSDDFMTAADFSRLVVTAKSSLLVVTVPEPLSFVAKLLPFTSIVFPSGPVAAEALGKWMKTFYQFLSQSRTLSDASSRASAQYCSCMILYPKLPSVSEQIYAQGATAGGAVNA